MGLTDKNQKPQNIMANTTTTAGRPRIKVKFPRKAKFTAKDVIELNECSPLTVRANINSLVKLAELVIVGKEESAGRGRPRILYSFVKTQE
jgi:predicted ArsR family transcriptional regulator